MSQRAMDKAVILARGLGTRMRQQDDHAAINENQARLAQIGLKAMIPIDRPFMDYVLHDLADAGYRRVCLVIGPEHDVVREYYGRKIHPQRLRVDFAVQEKPRGTADAVAAAESFAAQDDFLVINSDNYYPAAALAALRQTDQSALAAFERRSMIAGSNIPPERITRFAVVQIDEQGYLARILEKPDEKLLAKLPEPICLSMNCWRFSPAIFTACRSIALSPRGELELPDAVQYAIDKLSQRFQALTFKLPVLDLTSRSDIARVTEILKGRPINL